ncbi:MAG: DNA-directed DNA polymerase II small subunit [Candidatus Helarchaeota archaeon]|nr:DNA-directed DNA polymerase II small subunit [Candidatus Helarchaeota archaeon]
MYKKEIIKILLNFGLEITPDALDYLSYQNDPINFLNDFIEKFKNIRKNQVFITLDLIKEINSKKNQMDIKSDDEEIKISKGTYFESEIKDIEADIGILKDPTGRLYGKGQVEDFRDLFRSRYKKIYLLLMDRTDVKGSTSILEAKKLKDKEITIVGIIQEKKETSSKNIYLQIEDFSDNISVLIPHKDKELIHKALKILTDEVICIKGSIWKNDTFMANEIIFPDIPQRNYKKLAEIPIYVALISDTHFGSKQFLKEKFQNFIDWINGRSGNEEQIEIASRLKYIIIAGDIVDGIGVYPSQKDDLELIDIKSQYETAANYLKQIPEYINIIIIPGGAHDAIRKALPHPAIPKKYARSLYDLKNVTMLGNPTFIEIHGVQFLVYHGDSFDDVISSIPGLTYEHPEKAMQELLIARHLAPSYGQKTGISPEIEDWLVIDEIPNVIHCGHVHINGYKDYKGVKLINSGCFQSLTSFQKEKGIRPTPGMVPIINLQTLKVKMLTF